MPPDRNDIEESESSAPSEDGALDLEAVSETAPPELEILKAPRNVDSVVSRIDAGSSPEAFVHIDLDSEAPEDLVDDRDPLDLPEALAALDAPEDDGAPAALDASEDDGNGPDTGSGEGADEEIEEFEDFEEIDDYEVVEDERQGGAPHVEEEQAAAASSSSPPPMPPPMPVAKEPALAPPLAPAPVAAAADEIAPQLVDFAAESVLDTLLDGREALDWKGRADKLTRELAQAEGRGRVGELAYELGELYERYLDDEAGAVKAYGKALQADPSLRANLWAIRRIFYRRKLWPNLAKLIGAELRFASSDRQRADLHVERGRILLDEVGDTGAAQASFEQASALDPDNITALLALERIARATSDKKKLGQVIEALAGLSGRPERKAALLVDLAREYRLSREQPDEARALLARAAELDVLHDEVAREREALAIECDDPSGLAASLERRISRLADSFGPAGLPGPEQGHEDDGSAQVLRKMLALRRHQSQVLAQSGDSEGAWACLQDALLLCPEDTLLLTDLAELAERLGRYDELAELVATRESGEVDPSRALSLALRRASALAKAGKQEEADELLRARANATPGYLPLVIARELQAGAKSSWPQLAALQTELADALRLGTGFGPGADSDPEPAAAATHYVVAGDLLRFGAGDLDGARTRYLQALEVCPGHLPALQALSSQYSSQGSFEELAQLLELQSESGDSEHRAGILEELSAIYLLAGKGEEELSVVRRLQGLRPEDKSLQRRLVELLRENAMRDELADELGKLAAGDLDNEARAHMLFERGRILASQRPDLAAECFTECLDIWPDDVIVRESLRDALRAQGDYKGLADRLAQEVNASSGGEALSVLARESLAVVEFRLEDHKSASELAVRLCERQPDDLALLLDAIACLEASAPTPGESGALADLYERLVAVSDGALKSNAQLRLGTLQLGLGRPLDAEQSFQDATRLGSVPATLELYGLAAAQSDAPGKADALVALAELVDTPEQKASLLEQAAWQRALAMDDAAAANLFQRASEGPVGNVGALWGTSLLAAKLGDKDLQSESLEKLAHLLTGSYARSSMLLRAGMLADVSGDEPLALRRLEQARSIAPQDAGTAVVRADRLAPLPPTTTLTVDELLARAELCDMRSVLADSGPARIDWELERADCLERAGHLQEALQAVASVLDQRADDIRALQLLRRICLRGSDRQGLARADLALARLIGDSQGRLQLLREAAHIFDDELAEVGAAIRTYRKIVEEDPGAPEYERLISLLVDHQDVRALYRCYSARLNHFDALGDQRSRVEIFLARSRIREGIGDLIGAARDLKALLKIDPIHSAALFERARLLERSGEAQEAADLFQRFLAIEADPERRASAELSLSHLLADSLDDLTGAIEQLEHVLRQSPRDLEVRERFISLLLKAKQPDRAIQIMREQSSLRASDGERARDELRIATLLRDRDDRAPALQSLSKARQYDPLNMDALRELVELSGTEKRTDLLRGAARDIRRAISDEPLRASLYERLLTVGQWSEDNHLIRQSLQALAELGTLSADQQRNLDALSVPLRKLGKRLGEEAWRIGLKHRDAGGFSEELWSTIAPGVAELVDGTPAGLGFERSQRTRSKAVATAFPVIADMAALLGLEIEVYVSGAQTGVARAVASELPTICLGDKLAAAETREQRFAIARSIAHAKLGTGNAADLEEADLYLYFGAAAALAGVRALPGVLAQRLDQEAVIAAAKSLGKVLGRRARKDLTLLATRFSELGDPLHWRRGTQLSAARFGLLVCGSVAAAFDVMDVGKGGRALSDDVVAQGLLAWSVSEEHMQLLASLSQAGEG